MVCYACVVVMFYILCFLCVVVEFGVLKWSSPKNVPASHNDHDHQQQQSWSTIFLDFSEVGENPSSSSYTHYINTIRTGGALIFAPIYCDDLCCKLYAEFSKLDCDKQSNVPQTSSSSISCLLKWNYLLTKSQFNRNINKWIYIFLYTYIFIYLFIWW